ncbi:unnamed protein product [Amoebophrya sp. A25]|nr:unnamed protein product [Amoebophrya sp. A25]|eukprot:GSA25T00006909001.1
MASIRPKGTAQIRDETTAGLEQLANARNNTGSSLAGEPEPKRQRTDKVSMPSALADDVGGSVDTSLNAIKSAAATYVNPAAHQAGGSSSSSNVKGHVGGGDYSDLNPKQLAGSHRVPSVDGERCFWFYYQDAHEDVAFRNGVCRVVLFGKVMQGARPANCAVVVNGMKRNVFLLLKKQGLSEEEHKKEAELAFQEFCETQLKKALRLGKNMDALSTVQWKAVKRKYVFEKPIPHPHGELQFCKVSFDGSSGTILEAGGQHYSDIFGAQTSFLEMLFKKRSLKGPMWLRVRNPKPGMEDVSLCPLEAHVYSHKDLFSQSDMVKKRITPLTKMPSVSPPMTLAMIGVKTRQRKRGGEHELVMLCIGWKEQPFQVDSPDPDISRVQSQMRRWARVRQFADDAKLPVVNGRRVELPSMGPNYECEVCNTEHQLLQEFLTQLRRLDPDVLVMHNAYGFGLDILGNRINAQRLKEWHMASRLRRTGDFQYRKTGASGFYLGRQLTIGRLVCDTLLMSRDLIPKQNNYEIPHLMKLKFDMHVPEHPPPLVDYKDAKVVKEYAAYAMDEMICTFMLMHRLEMLTLTKQLTIIGGNLWAHSLQNKRAERNEYLLIHEFHREKYVCPDKAEFGGKKKGNVDLEDLGLGGGDGEDGNKGANAPTNNKKAAYSGGLVLEPKVGLYDDFVLLLDFNSLYPSLIQEYNICFSTVQRPRGDRAGLLTEQEMMKEVTPPMARDEKSAGVLPRVLKRLVDSRKDVKKEIKTTPAGDKQKLGQLETKQLALKLTANSMYGCLGFANSRFHAKPIAALITQRGRSALSETQQLIETMNFDVVYGDTDSVFVRSKTKDYHEAVKIASRIKSEVNKKYRKLEIDLDGVFQRILLLKKKKYAGVKIKDWEKKLLDKEYKGLDLVRRDWCRLSSDMGKEILDKVLGGELADDAVVEWIHEYLKETRKKIDKDELYLASFLITKSISKMPHEYPDPRNQPHVMVAKRMMEKGLTVNPGLEVAYLICKRLEGEAGEGSAIKPEDVSNIGMCAFSMAELQDPKNKIQLDKEWYLKSQIHPPLMRLLAPIDGTDAGKIAEALGMDSTKFMVASLGAGAVEHDAEEASTLVEEILNPITRYKGRKLLFEMQCSGCSKLIPLQKFLGLNEDLQVVNEDAMLRCPFCDLQEPRMLLSQILHGFRNIHIRYMEGITTCTEQTCRRVSKTLSLKSCGQRCENPNCNAEVKPNVSQQLVQDEINLAMVLLLRAKTFLLMKKGQRSDTADTILRALDRSQQYVQVLGNHSEYNQIDVGRMYFKIYN